MYRAKRSYSLHSATDYIFPYFKLLCLMIYRLVRTDR